MMTTWMGGSLPRRGICLADSPLGRRYRAVRKFHLHALMAERMLTMTLDGQYPYLTRSERKEMWNRASLNAWATVRGHQ